MRGCLTTIVIISAVLWFLGGGSDQMGLGPKILTLSNPESVVASDDYGFSLSDGKDFIWKFTYNGIFDDTLVYFDKMNFKMQSSKFLTFIALTEKDYKEFLELRTCSTCPAPFLNRNTKMFAVIYDDPNVEQIISSAKRGDHISIYGDYLNFSLKTLSNGDIRFSMPPKFNFLYINEINKY